ncbi:M1 family aminopeptidase [Lacimicrobium alkaliphilum]|nr:M1 family aminopeptidase [Lacimicrobium alkaliphilum]
MRRFYRVSAMLLIAASAQAETDEPFAPLELPLTEISSPTGTPSTSYWQQQLSYKIDARVNTDKASLTATAVLNYRNQSPDTLKTLWFELPQQRFAQGSLAREKYQAGASEAGGTTRLRVTDSARQPLKTGWQDTLVAVTLDTPLKPGQQVQLHFAWDLKLVSRSHPLVPRSGYEQINGENRLLAFAQWYPRALRYGPQGWNLRPFVKNAEFSLEMADFSVTIDASPQYLLLGSGDWQSAGQNLPESVFKQYQQVSADTPATLLGPGQPWPVNNQQPWRFKGEQLRDFTFVVARDVIWQARKVTHSQGDILITAAYPDNGRWLWHKYALEAGVFAIDQLSEWLGQPAAKSIHLVNIAGLGMEYPGLKLVGFRGPDADITGPAPQYSRTQKYDVIGGILHEIAHAWMPMTVNTDERAEGFFDEGITSYLAFWLEQRWSENFQSFYGEPARVGAVMTATDYLPPVTFAEEVNSKLDSHYHVPAVALNILRETLLGRAQFDTIVADFFHIWRGRNAGFSDFVRFVNQQSGEQLDWFWRGWFMHRGYVDIELERAQVILPQDWNRDQKLAYLQHYPSAPSLTRIRNGDLGQTYEQRNPGLLDRHSLMDDQTYARLGAKTKAVEQPQLRVTLRNKGSIPMPAPLQLHYADGTVQSYLLSVDLWRQNPEQVEIMLSLAPDKAMSLLHLDPLLQIGDARRVNHRITQPEF